MIHPLLSGWPELAIIMLVFLAAGAVKGVIGLGLPTLSLALLTVTIGMKEAMALLIMPSLLTNALQAAAGGHGRVILARIWPFLLAATLCIFVGALALTRVDAVWLSALLGGVLSIYALLGLARVRMTLTPRHEAWAGPLLGIANGVLTGMTGTFVFPGVPYFQAIGLPRDQLVQAMGILFLASTLALAAALHGNGLFTADLGVISTLGILPALLGMWAGQRLRQRLSEEIFRRLIFAGLLALGLYIVAMASSA